MHAAAADNQLGSRLDSHIRTRRPGRTRRRMSAISHICVRHTPAATSLGHTTPPNMAAGPPRVWLIRRDPQLKNKRNILVESGPCPIAKSSPSPTTASCLPIHRELYTTDQWTTNVIKVDLPNNHMDDNDMSGARGSRPSVVKRFGRR